MSPFVVNPPTSIVFVVTEPLSVTLSNVSVSVYPVRYEPAGWNLPSMSTVYVPPSFFVNVMTPSPVLNVAPVVNVFVSV